MDIEGNWERIKAHHDRLKTSEIRSLAEVLFRGQEDWLGKKLQHREDVPLAFEFLGHMGNSGSQKAADILLAQLEAQDEAQQIAAAEALKKCEPGLVKSALAQMMRRQSQNSVKAGEILLCFGQEGADLLWGLWFEANAPVNRKAQILRLLAESGDERAISLAFLAFLSEEEELTGAALKAAERLEARVLWGNVVECLSGNRWQIRGKAVQLLGRWREKQALPYLMEMEKDPDPWVEEERENTLALLMAGVKPGEDKQ